MSTWLVRQLAYLLNTNTKFWQFWYYLPTPAFWLFWIVTVALLWVYMLWISLVYYLFFVFRVKDKFQPKSLLANKVGYFLLAIWPVLLFHLSMLQIVFMQQKLNLWHVGYLKSGFWILLMSIIGFAVLVYYRPGHAIFLRMIDSVVSGVVRFIVRNYTRPEEKAQVILVLPSKVAEDEASPTLAQPKDPRPQIPLHRLLFLRFSREGSIFYLISGEKIYATYTNSILREWSVGAWFVQIRKGFYVNMWYVGHLPRSKYRLELDPVVMAPFMAGMGVSVEQVEQMLTVNKDLRKNVAQHFEHREDMEKEGWSDTVSC